MADQVGQLVLTVLCVSLLTGVSTFANSLIIAAFSFRKSIRTVSNFFFLSLTLANLACGLSYPFQCVVNLGIVSQRSVCVPMVCILLVQAFVIIWSLIALTIERYISITRPLTAWSIVTERRAIIAIGFIYISAAVCGGIVPGLLSMSSTSGQPSFNDSSSSSNCRFSTLVPSPLYGAFLAANRVVSVCIFVLVYIKIFFVVRRHVRAIAALTVELQVSPPATNPGPSVMAESSGTTPSNGKSTEGANEKAKMKRQIKSTILLFAAVLYHCLAWIPLMVIVPDKESQGFVVVTLIHFITYSSTAVNPVIYGLCNREIRSAVISLFKSSTPNIQGGRT